MTDNPRYSAEQYQEANRLACEGFRPISSKYKVASAPPTLPSDMTVLMDLLKKVDPEAYIRVQSSVEDHVTRAIGTRQIQLERGTYEALKAIRSEMLGVGGFQRLAFRVVEIRRPGHPTVSRRVRISHENEERTLCAIVDEEVQRFPDAPAAATWNLDVGASFLRTKGVEVVLLPEGSPQHFRAPR